jgi:hypothetical protein
MSPEQLDILVRDIQADARHMELLQLLSAQIERLVNSGSPDLRVFYRDLKEAELMSEDDLRQLQEAFDLEDVSNQFTVVRLQADSVTKGLSS